MLELPLDRRNMPPTHMLHPLLIDLTIHLSFPPPTITHSRNLHLMDMACMQAICPIRWGSSLVTVQQVWQMFLHFLVLIPNPYSCLPFNNIGSNQVLLTSHTDQQHTPIRLKHLLSLTRTILRVLRCLGVVVSLFLIPRLIQVCQLVVAFFHNIYGCEDCLQRPRYL